MLEMAFLPMARTLKVLSQLPQTDSRAILKNGFCRVQRPPQKQAIGGNMGQSFATRQRITHGFLASVARYLLASVLAVPLLSGGCSRSHYRYRADLDVTGLVAEKAEQVPSSLKDFSIEPLPQSRFYDPNPADTPPMPPDDPASHRLLHEVYGKRGANYEAKYGCTRYVENPDWLSFLPRDEHGNIPLDRRTAVQLALIHSPQYQQELEDIYLSALQVSLERFRFQVQFFGGNDTFFTKRGPLGGRGSDSSSLETSFPISARRLMATGTQLVVEVANSITWQFSGRDGYSAITPVSLSLIQPLLRGAGRAVILEDLTQAERDLLANLRQFERFRQGFYLSIVAGLSPGPGPSPGGIALGGASPGLTASVGGYLSLVEQELQIRNQRANVASLRDSLERIDAFYAAGRISRRQVDEIRQNLYSSQLALLGRQNTYANQLDAYKILLGLPPHLPVRIEDPLLQPFDLLDPALSDRQEEVSQLLNPVREVWTALRDNQTAEEALHQAKTELANAAAAQQAGNTLAVIRSLARTSESILRAAYALRITSLVRAAQTLGKETDVALLAPADQMQQAASKLTQTAGELIAQAEERARVHRDQVLPKAAGLLGTIAKALPGFADAMGVHLAKVDRDLERLMETVPLRERWLERLANRPEFQTGDVDPRIADRSTFRRRVVELHAEYLGNTAPEVKKAADALLLDEAEKQWFTNLREMPGLRHQLEDLALELQKFASGLAEMDRQSQDVSRWNQLYGQVENYLDQLASGLMSLSLLQARVRLEIPVLTPVQLDPEEAFQIARENRLDWMNMRAALVDQWRQVEIAANRLKSDLSLIFDGNVTTTSNTLAPLHNTMGSVRVGVQFDAPLTRRQERNAYRQALIAYQRARREYYVFEDRVRQVLRENLRAIELAQLQFELQRAGVLTAIGRVEQQRLELMRPPRPGQEEFTLGATTARDLVTALDALLRAQNEFLDGWVRYEVQRMVLDYNLGTMRLDENGMWIDPGPIERASQPSARSAAARHETDLPPEVQLPPELLLPSELDWVLPDEIPPVESPAGGSLASPVSERSRRPATGPKGQPSPSPIFPGHEGEETSLLAPPENKVTRSVAQP
jgi:outer membrane protein TolC